MSSIEGWQEEQRSAYLYRILAEVEREKARAALFTALAGEADKQADIWARDILATGGRLPEGYRPDVRTRIVVALLRQYGPRPLRSVLSAMKVRGMSLYSQP